jgi:hypothetical protein
MSSLVNPWALAGAPGGFSTAAGMGLPSIPFRTRKYKSIGRRPPR